MGSHIKNGLKLQKSDLGTMISADVSIPEYSFIETDGNRSDIEVLILR